ncbi:hypothetical protein F3Y22_tig00005406pilonHSYRG00482 [Hibiscus syriacus]|uniref:P-type ATPase A domain-containing protein n=1 Tax=Hibiscus syriacus TaxID=106335 RepID=A0A6A3CEG8_HIBSY|nr:hypothetical protein F3Y22_tig00005406pilonHSYRG00482 [Hibiscus syriacus]
MLFYLLQTLNTALSEPAKLTSLFSNGGNGNVIVEKQRGELQDCMELHESTQSLLKKTVFRDGKWIEEDASVLFPGDIISIKLSDIISADARLLDGDPLKIDQSALTGDSLPVTKGPGNIIYSGSTCKQGEIEAVVIATGFHMFFGKAAHLVDSINQQGHFQKVLTAIGNFYICSIAVRMITEIIVMYPIQHRKYRPGIDNLLVLLIGGIPIAMPTVLSVTMAIGSHPVLNP